MTSLSDPKKKKKSLFYLGRIQVNLDGICTNKFLPDQSLWLRGIGIPKLANRKLNHLKS